MKILIVAAHPDDEVLGCGGTIARLAQEGHEVFIAIFADGVTGRYAHHEDADPSLIEEARDASRRASELLGAKERFWFGLPDQRLDTLPCLDLNRAIEDLVSRLEPQVVFTHRSSDLNMDHSVVFRATLVATRPLDGSPVREVYSYAVASSTEWTFQQLEPVFRPNMFVDITATLERKIQAMQLYEKEARPFPHPRSPEMLEASARHWGSVAGLQAAEPFVLVRSVSPDGELWRAVSGSDPA